MKVGFLTFEHFHKKSIDSIGGSRIRANNLVKYWDEAEIYRYGEKYDVIIFQKIYWINYAEDFKGIKILDICDADYLHWGYKTIEMISHCDAITCSTKELALDIANFTDKPVWVIPDRLDLNSYPFKKKHKNKATKIGWYGYAHNFSIINESGIIKGIYDLNKEYNVNLEFIVISNNTFVPPTFAKDSVKITNLKWTAKGVDRDLQKCDIIVNPRLKTGHWKYKSNNKTINAWALGIPVANTKEELIRFLEPKERTREIKDRAVELRSNYNLKQSIKEYKDLIKELKCTDKNSEIIQK